MIGAVLALALAAPSSFVALDDIEPTILQDMRYATPHNFVGSCTAPRGRRFPDNSIGMGTSYDCFDPRAHTLDSRVSGRARKNRLLLKRTMEAAGFEPYANEWWHFTLRNERYPDRAFDFPVSRKSLR